MSDETVLPMHEETELLTCACCQTLIPIPYVWVNQEEVVCSRECYLEYLSDYQR